MADPTKDVYSLNELESLQRLSSALNEFLVDWEEDDNLRLSNVLIVVRDKDRRKTDKLWGSFTLYPNIVDLQWEPGFKADEVIE